MQPLNEQSSVGTEYVADLIDVATPHPERRTIADPAVAAELIDAETRSRVAAVLERWPATPTIMLSGGVDSIYVAAIAVELGAKLEAITVVTSDGDEASDEATAVEVAHTLGIKHSVHRLSDGDVVALARKSIQLLGTSELWEVTAAIPLLSARTDFTNGPILTGSGADAIFGGGRTLTHDAEDAAATIELDAAIRKETSSNFRRHRLVPHFYEALLGDAGDRLIHVFQTRRFWELSETLAPAALFHQNTDVAHDKTAVRIACERVLGPANAHLAWTRKNPIQRSSGIMAALERATRRAAAELPGATTYTNPLTEPADAVATRLYLANLH